MQIDKITRHTRRGLSEAKRSAYHYFAPTADLSAPVPHRISRLKTQNPLSAYWLSDYFVKPHN